MTQQKTNAAKGIDEPLLPNRFEAHITVAAAASTGWGGSSAAGFQAFKSELPSDWKASIIGEDEVDDMTGNWFLSARSDDYEDILSDTKDAVKLLTAKGYLVLRAKVEETLFDTKFGDSLPEIAGE